MSITRKILEVCLKQNELDFDNVYKSCCNIFNDNNALFSISGDKYEELEKQWPRGVGVYAVWRVSSENNDELLYIGMTGKIKKNFESNTKLLEPENGFSKRALRYHPYSFTKNGPNKNHFEYGPKFPIQKIKKVHPEKRYSSKIPLCNIRVDCFKISDHLKLAPSFLEALLLQEYFNKYNFLPKGNNQL